MNIIKYIALILSLLIMSNSYASNSYTPYWLRTTNNGVVKYTIKESYESVYRKVVQGARNCYDAFEVGIDGFIFPDNKTAEVSMKFIDGGSSDPIFMLDIVSSGDNTNVVVYHHFTLTGDWKSVAEATLKWISNNEKSRATQSFCPTLYEVDNE